jgi:hypothetical protein
MQNQQLLDYIKTQLEQGIDINTIKNALVGQGWSKEDVEATVLLFTEAQPPALEKKGSLFFWKKNVQVGDDAYAPNEEIDAKRTSKLGYFFLILMVIFGIWQGNNFLSALQRSLPSPEQNSSCLNVLSTYVDISLTSQHGYAYTYGGYGDSSNCDFSKREIALGIEKLYNSVSASITSIEQAQRNISDLQSQINNKKYNRNEVVSDYEASLLENIANSNGNAFDERALRAGVVSQGEQITTLNDLLSKEEARKESLLISVRQQVSPYAEKLLEAERQYFHEYTIYQLEQFLLSLLFVAPILFFLWRRYHVSKETRSEYAIIWGGMLATVSLIFAQIILVFIYEILPHKILQEIFAFLAEIKIVWAILYWLGFILVPLFFGYLVYLIQKKFYNKRAVMMRALKSGHCPRCSLKIDQTMNHCPVCGHALKTKCASCGQMSIAGGAYCDACGTKK